MKEGSSPYVLFVGSYSDSVNPGEAVRLSHPRAGFNGQGRRREILP